MESPSRSVSSTASPVHSATPLAAAPSPAGSSSAIALAVVNLGSGSADSGSHSLVLVAIVVSVVVLLALVAAIVAYVLIKKRREAAREKLRGSSGVGDDKDGAVVSISNRMYSSGGDGDVSTEKGRAAVAAFKAARLAAARAEQEAAAMDLPQAADCAPPSTRRQSRAPQHRGKVVVVKAVFGPQETKCSEAGSDGGRAAAAKQEALNRAGTQMAMLRQSRGAGAGGTGTAGLGGFGAVNPLLVPKSKGAPPPPLPQSMLLGDRGAFMGDGDDPFTGESPLRRVLPASRGPST